ALSLFALNVIGQDIASNKDESSSTGEFWKYSYCTSMKDGKLIVMNENKELTSDVTLANGAKITTSAILVKNDGSRVALKNDECVDKDGNVVRKEDMKKEDMKKEQPKKEEPKKGY